MKKSASSLFAKRLDNLAKVAVYVGLRPVLGQQVILSAPIEALDMVRLVTKHAYEAGASLVTPLYDDGTATISRVKFADVGSFDTAPDWLFKGMAAGFENNAARMAIASEIPGQFAGLDTTRIGRSAKARAGAYKIASEYITAGAINWNISPAANPAWAKQVFPDLPPKQALAALWEEIFRATRADEDDPVAAWNAHNAELARRRAQLNARNYQSIRFFGAGTDLTVGLAEGHAWAGGETVGKNGVTFNANIPTEEVFCAPHRFKVDGYVLSTRPLSLYGQVVENIYTKFENGLIVDAKADKSDDAFQSLLNTDEGSRRLGEVALVPHSSRISKSGVLFYNTLFDENAACHIAVGQSYNKCFVDGKTAAKEDLIARGANQSNAHIDWMIGSNQINVDGICQDGSIEPIMRGCEWVNA